MNWEKEFDKKFVNLRIINQAGEDVGSYNKFIKTFISKQKELSYMEGVDDEVNCIESSGEHGKAVQKIRKELLDEVREKIIIKKVSQTGRWDGEYTEEGFNELLAAVTNDFIEIQLKKLKELEEG